MRTLAVINHKGGAGKTTTSVNLAAAIGETGARVLLIDLDPQGSASDWVGAHDDSRGMFDVFVGSAEFATARPADDRPRRRHRPGLALAGDRRADADG